MSTNTVQRVNFTPVSDILATQRRDFPLADKTLADPLNSVALVDGEWMVIDSSYKLVRATDIETGANNATQTSYVLFAERGRYDVRAMADVKMPIVFMGEYEADTRIYSAVGLTSVGQPLMVQTIAIGTRNYSGLIAHAGGGQPIVGRVTRLPQYNGGQLRFIRAHTI
jgi:hypothetical protein